MGSAILASPAMKRLKKLYPEAELYFLIFEKNRASVDILDLIKKEQVLVIRDQSLGTFLTDLFKTIIRMRREKLDVVFDLELFARVTSLLSFLSGAKVKVGFHKFRMEGLYRGNFHTHKIQYNYHQHISKTFLSFIEVLSYPHKNYPTMDRPIPDRDIQGPSFTPAQQDLSHLWEKLKESNPEIRPGHELILFNPSAGDIPIRAWPVENYVKLARKFLNDPNQWVILTGALKDQEVTGAIKTAVNDQRCIDFAGETSFEDLMHLFCISKVLVTNDSGPAHFASLTPIRNYIFFGPESPLLYRPLGPNAYPIYSHFPCSPCLTAFNHRDTPCQDNKCLKAITVEEVYHLITNPTPKPGSGQ
jgi:ADP-heptose:LPS heptosyltransferase